MSNGPSNNGEQPIQLSTPEPALEDGSEKNSFAFGPGLRDDSLSRPGTESLCEHSMPDDFETHESAQTLYFAYSSNIWIDQMNRRCPENKYVGTAKLHDW
jgi:hypothetical protein